MGLVPRIGTFKDSLKNVNSQKTDWSKLYAFASRKLHIVTVSASSELRKNVALNMQGYIPVIGIRDLVEIKKTRRLEDYPVISNLVRIEYENLYCLKKIKNNDWKWILRNSFDIEDILYYLNSHKVAKTVSTDISRKCLSFCLKAAANPEREEYMRSASCEIVLEIERLREQDRKYWNLVINELKELKQNNQLLFVGGKAVCSVTDYSTSHNQC